MFKGKIVSYLRQTFGFSRREASGFIVLVACTFLLMFSPLLIRWYYTQQASLSETDSLAIDNIRIALTEKPSQRTWPEAEENKKSSIPVTLFKFDPNQVTREELQQLGLDERLAQRIVNYRNKGGVFHKKEDFLKIYGLSEHLYKRLSPYIFIENVSSAKVREAKPKEYQVQQIDINKADSVALLTLKGIGPTLAGRIVKFRNQLGGFYSIQQLEEVYGLKKEVFELLSSMVFVEKSFAPNKISLTSCNYQILSSHPYFRKFAGVIMKQKKTGVIVRAQTLLTTGLITEQDYNRMLPYLYNE